MIIKINKTPYEKNRKLYKKDTYEFYRGLTILVGKNGIGKTTLLNSIEQHCKNNNIPVFTYDNYKDGGKSACDYYGFVGDNESLWSTVFHSEGEQIFYNLGKKLEEMAKFVNANTNAESFILLDAIDSGLDVEGITQLVELINKICCKNDKLYFILTANNYALIHNNKCLDVKTGEYVTFNEFTKFKNFILKQYKSNTKR